MGRSRGLVFVGTQALVQDHIGFADLRLAVVDEQHRFGVAEREALSAKGGSVHVLLMTATPIPQVLGQVIHADLDVSDLRAAPVGRLAVSRRASSDRAPWKAPGTWCVEEAAAGHRTFVVVPLIEAEGTDDGTEPASEDADPATQPTGVGSAEAEAERLATLLAPLRVGMVHGRLKAADRDEVMGRFRDGDLDVLVGTTVVEVGVDVPQATMMIIESADRFGLAQLHQLRGRVGRGNDPVVLRAGDRGRRGFGRDDPPAGRPADHGRLRAGRAGHRAAQGRGAPGPAPERPAAAACRAPGRPAPSPAVTGRPSRGGGAGRQRRAAGARQRAAGAGAHPAAGWRASVPATCWRRTSSMADAGRVIGGSAGGLRLSAPGEGTRPFGDRVKQALFGSLETDPQEPLAGPFLDLFAGSGAAGIEALSRGAPSAVFVERDAGAARVITDNLARTRLDGGRVVRADVLRFLEGDALAAGGPFSGVVLDPPYAETELLEAALERLADPERGWLSDSAVVVAKHPWRWTGESVVGCLERARVRRFGETALTWYRRLGP